MNDFDRLNDIVEQLADSVVNDPECTDGNLKVSAACVVLSHILHRISDVDKTTVANEKKLQMARVLISVGDTLANVYEKMLED